VKNAKRCTCLSIAAIALLIATEFFDSAIAAVIPAGDLYIVTADDNDSTRNIADGLKKNYPSAKVINNVRSTIPNKRIGTYIAVGPTALRSLLLANDLGGTIISLFTSSQAFRSIVDNAPRPRSLAVTAIYAEPSPVEQFHLISGLYKKPISVAVLLSEKTAYLQPILMRAAAQKGITLTIEHVDADDNLNRTLTRVERAAVILAIPDDTIYNIENIRNILITTYRHNQSVVGFSTAFVKAGALASTYSDIDDILVQAGELIDEYAATGNLPEPQFPKYFRVVVNENVARSLNVVVDDAVRTFSRKPGERK
jgi:hypothetical protein